VLTYRRSIELSSSFCILVGVVDVVEKRGVIDALIYLHLGSSSQHHASFIDR